MTAPPDENPSWNFWDVLGLTVITFIAMFGCVLGVAYFVHRRFSPTAPFLDSLKRPEVIVGGQLLAYFLVLLVMYAMVASQTNGRVLEGLRWNWPRNWGLYLLAGVGLELCLVPFAYLLPMPKHAPIDDFFRTARDAYVLSLFGVFFAPLFEELFFRGFLYPVAQTWLHGVLHSPTRMRLGRNVLLTVTLWGYVLHRLPQKTRLYVVILLFAGTIGLLLARMISPEGRMQGRWTLPVACFTAWSFVAYALSASALFKASLLPLFLALALELLLRRGSARGADAVAVAGAIGFTACAFALIHASQLKYSWGPVLVIFLVGVTLTTVRALKKSVAATVLMHMAYNGTIFLAAYIATSGFRHMEKFNQ